LTNDAGYLAAGASVTNFTNDAGYITDTVAGTLTAEDLVLSQGYTVGTLPATPAVGTIARVTDAITPTLGASVGPGGGSAFAVVCWNGSQWSVMCI
jgi:hypothetical protein